MKHYGLFGGTFNPIHRGHLHAVEAVRTKFPLDRIYLIPSALPPHKQVDNLAAAGDRIEMIRRAAAHLEHLFVSDMEVSRSGPSYTIDTVSDYQARMPDDTRLYLIMGVDAFLEIHTWKSYQELMAKIPFIVLSRPAGQRRQADLDLSVIENYLKRTFHEPYAFSAEKSCFLHDTRPSIYLIDIQPLDISSTEIRSRIKQGRSVKTLLPEPVYSFIKTRGLYL